MHIVVLSLYFGGNRHLRVIRPYVQEKTRVHSSFVLPIREDHLGLPWFAPRRVPPYIIANQRRYPRLSTAMLINSSPIPQCTRGGEGGAGPPAGRSRAQWNGGNSGAWNKRSPSPGVIRENHFRWPRICRRNQIIKWAVKVYNRGLGSGGVLWEGVRRVV